MATTLGIIDTVYRRTAPLARRRNDPGLAPNEDDLYVLVPFVKSGAIWLAGRTGRLEANVPVTLVDGVFEYDIHDAAGAGAAPPTNVRAVRAAQLDESFLLHEEGYKVLANCRLSTAETGAPVMFGLYEDKLVVYPIPTAEIAEATPTLYLYYILASAHTEPAEVSWPTSENPEDDIVEWLPVELEAALVFYVMSEWFDSIAEFALAKEFEAKYRGRQAEETLTGDKAKRPSKTRRPARYF